MTAEYLFSILTVLVSLSTLTMGFALLAPKQKQPRQMERLASLAENVFVASLFALLALLNAK